MKHVNRIVALTAILLALGVHAHPSKAAVLCQAIGAQACLNALDALINSHSFVEAWATGAYNTYATRNCRGGPSSSGTYTFYGQSINKVSAVVDQLLPNVSCNECEARSSMSSLIAGYLGICAPSDDESWQFVGHFCELPGPQGALVIRENLSLYDAATMYMECGNGPATTKSACSNVHGCLQ